MLWRNEMEAEIGRKKRRRGDGGGGGGGCVVWLRSERDSSITVS